jgi:hypothetical protein
MKTDAVVEYEDRVNEGQDTTNLEDALFNNAMSAWHLVELYAQEQAGTDTMIEGIQETIQAYIDNRATGNELKEILDELDSWSSGRQARETWGK